MTTRRTVGPVLSLLLVAGMLVSIGAAANGVSGDGVALVDPGSGMWHLRAPDRTTDEFFYGMPGDVPLLGDWDCDGEDTAALYRQSNGYVYLRNSNEFGVADDDFFFGARGDIPLAGDWDGDGCDTFSIYRPSEGQVYISNELGTRFADYSFYFGVPGDRPFAGDFDGDGITTVGLYRQTSGLVYLRNSLSTGFADLEFFYGIPSDRIIVGDWDGDGDDSVGIFRPGEARFYLSNENEQGIADIEFEMGSSAWLPVAGRFSIEQPPPSTTLPPGPGSEFLNPPSPNLGSSFRLMAVGDSITQGFDGTGDYRGNSYRYYLWSWLTSSGYDVDFVGERHASSYRDGTYAVDAETWDPDHESESGLTSSGIALMLALDHPQLTARGEVADVALVHAGTNDGIATLESGIRSIIVELRDYNPHIVILLAEIIEWANGKTPDPEEFHAVIRAVAEEETTFESPIILVDQASAFDPDKHLQKYPDNLHPNDAGDRRIALTWYNELMRLLPARNVVVNGDFELGTDPTHWQWSTPVNTGYEAHEGDWVLPVIDQTPDGSISGYHRPAPAQACGAKPIVVVGDAATLIALEPDDYVSTDDVSVASRPRGPIRTVGGTEERPFLSICLEDWSPSIVPSDRLQVWDSKAAWQAGSASLGDFTVESVHEEDALAAVGGSSYLFEVWVKSADETPHWAQVGLSQYDLSMNKSAEGIVYSVYADETWTTLRRLAGPLHPDTAFVRVVLRAADWIGADSEVPDSDWPDPDYKMPSPLLGSTLFDDVRLVLHDSASLLENGSFDSDVTGWTESASGAVTHHPSWGARVPGAIKITDGSDTQAVEAGTKDLIPVIPYEQYLLSGFVQGADAEQDVGVSVSQFAASECLADAPDAQQLAGRNVATVVNAPSGRWTQFNLMIDSLDPRTGCIRINLWPRPWDTSGERVGSAWFDDLSLIPYGDNLVVGGSFETVPAQWTGGDTSSDVRLFGGYTALRVGSQTEHTVAMMQKPVPVVPGEDYILSGWVKASSAAQQPTISLLQADSEGRELPVTPVTFGLDPFEVDWVPFEVLLNGQLDASTRLVAVQLSSGEIGASPGFVWFDDVQIHHVPPMDGAWIHEGGPVAAWWSPPFQKVGPVQILQDAAVRLPEVDISAARGEYEPFQLVLVPSEAVTVTEIELNDLETDSGAMLPVDGFTIREVEFVTVNQPTPNRGIVSEQWMPAAAATGIEIPDPLPLFEGDLELVPGRQQPIWVTAFVPPNQPAGVYRGEVTVVVAGADSIEIPVTLHVWDFDMPAEHHLGTAYNIDWELVYKHHNDARSSGTAEDVFAAYRKVFADHRLSPYDPIGDDWYTADPGNPPDSSTITIDFTDFDVAAHRAIDVLGVDSFRIWLPWIPGPGANYFDDNPLLPFSGWGGPPWRNYAAYLAQYDDLLVETVTEIADHLRAKGWLDEAYVYQLDEWPIERNGAVNAMYDLIDRAAPDLRRIYTTSRYLTIETVVTERLPAPHMEDEVGLVDVNRWVPIVDRYVPELAQDLRAQGDEVWWYPCTGPRAPYHNTFIDFTASDIRALVWNAWELDVEGMLYYDTTWWQAGGSNSGGLDSSLPWDPWLDPMSYKPPRHHGTTNTASGAERLVGGGFTDPNDEILPGAVVRNTTDGSTAHVLKVESSTTILHTPLSGGFDNAWEGDDKYEIIFGTWGNGDGSLLYPPRDWKSGTTSVEPVPSLRFELLREAIEDYEYFWMLEDAANNLDALAVEPGLVAEARALLDLPSDIVPSRTEFSLSAGAYATHRRLVAEKLLEVNAALSGWWLLPGDGLQILDIDGDGRDEALATGADGERLGLLQGIDDRLDTRWVTYDRVRPADVFADVGWNLRQGDRFFPADLDGDGDDEVVVVSPDTLGSGAEHYIGILDGAGSGLEPAWIGEGWVNPPGGTGASGWMLGNGDRFAVADLDGDSRDELVVANGLGKWFGVLELLGDELRVEWMQRDWIEPEDGSGPHRWQLNDGDRFAAVDTNGDGTDELVVSSTDGSFIGWLVWDGDAVVVRWLADEWFFSDGEFPPGCPLVGDAMLPIDVDGDGQAEVFIGSRDGECAGLMQEADDELVATWVGTDWVRALGNGGPYEWNLRLGDRFVVADLGDDGNDDIVVVSPDKEVPEDHLYIGVLSGIAADVVPIWIGTDWINPPGETGDRGWMLHDGDAFVAGDIDGDGSDEVLVLSRSGAWIGILEGSGPMNVTWMTKDRVAP